MDWSIHGRIIPHFQILCVSSMLSSITEHPDFPLFDKWSHQFLPHEAFRPRLGIVLGSGFKSFESDVDKLHSVSFSDLEGFPKSTVPGHEGRFLSSRLHGVDFVVSSGRVHLYEGHSAQTTAHAMGLFARLGISHVLLTNAAGLLNLDWNPGEFMIIKDHINLLGANPLFGLNVANPADKFMDMSQAYSPSLAQCLAQSFERLNIEVRSGIYAAVPGPSYETPAEVRMLHSLGADAVGMSTVPETIAARFFNIQVAGLSCLTNWGAGLQQSTSLSHEEVLAMGEKNASIGSQLIEAFIDQFRSLS